MLVMRTWLTDGIAQLSYLVGDDATHTAAVIDPRPDVQIYLDAAREQGLAITHVFETHVHADFMSGGRELVTRVGNATLCVSGESDPAYGYPVTRIRDGQTFRFGSVVVRARFTPGHTPEHLAYEIADADAPDEPWGVFTGDSLFVDSAGRPDLLGDAQTDALVRQLHHTLQDYFLKLPDDVTIYPGHGKGSACGPEIGDRLTSTIGYERRHNRYLQARDLEAFARLMDSGNAEAPLHYPKLKIVNAEGPPLLGAGPVVPPLPPRAFLERSQGRDVQLVDSRDMLAFGGGHVPGAINIGANKAEMSVFAGWVLDPQVPILLVLERDDRVDDVVSLLVRTGFVRFAGYLAGGMMAWNNAGLPLERVRQMPVREVADRKADLNVLDVREQGEWNNGHVPGATHAFFGSLVHSPPDLPRDAAVVTYCATGYRASMAASLLQRHGFRDVRSLPGSFSAWKNAGLPIEK
jgi:hydroxyacylglutathione hydrolase